MLQKRLHLLKFLAFPLDQVSIKNRHLALEALNYGAIIKRLRFRTGADTWEEMTVGLDEPEDYLKDTIHLGACAGRFAGRISGGVLQIDGEAYPLSNEEGITLHGGVRGFGRRFWEIEALDSDPERPEIRMVYRSAHGEEGFPGNVEARVSYRLDANSLIIRHEATTDRPTVINLTNHSYFKIDRQPLISHYLVQLKADRRLETDSRLLPTGRLLDVAGTDYDFRKERSLGDLKLDTPFVLVDGEHPSARIYSRVSGVRMQVYTDQPCIVVYTPGDFPAICLETQNFPDAPGYGHFPSALLRPGDTYVNESRFVFDKVP